ncbi:MAG: MarR family winged helix-turn-helix transcriptional regulator [Candidatus Acidiferrales bacterium]
MTALEKKAIPPEILKDSVLLHLAQAYLSVARRLEQKTKCSETRGFILATLRGGAERNQNQIATMLGFDRTVVHRAIKTLIREGLVSEKKAARGRALLVSLTPKGTKYRESLIVQRRAADEALLTRLPKVEIPILLRLLKTIAAVEL